MNARLAAADVPVRVAHLASVWMVYYTQPSRYHWMLQFYLRAEGVALSWVGSGRLIFGLHFSERDFETVAERFAAAALRMRADGWWWQDPSTDARAIERAAVREALRQVLRSRLPFFARPGGQARRPRSDEALSA
jgi:glutamate-1-semialdehyde 2,1-aminomutase